MGSNYIMLCNVVVNTYLWREASPRRAARYFMSRRSPQMESSETGLRPSKQHMTMDQERSPKQLCWYVGQRKHVPKNGCPLCGFLFDQPRKQNAKIHLELFPPSAHFHKAKELTHGLVDFVETWQVIQHNVLKGAEGPVERSHLPFPAASKWPQIEL